MKYLSWLKKERLMLWRTPAVWLVLALLMFSCSWLFWLMVDRYTQLQSAFVSMAQPPSVTDHLMVPFFKTMAQVSMLLIAVVSGMAIAQERSQGTWIHVFKQPNRLVANKWLASWSVSGFLLVTLGLAWLCLDGASQLHRPVIWLAALALVLLLQKMLNHLRWLLVIRRVKLVGLVNLVTDYILMIMDRLHVLNLE